ncbi:P-loop NTPase fold protein [Aliivibrio sp. S2TY2]|uniref:KAP P-loop n=1 Tax=Aliivibrio finisterrensis TaxID=511998 RepID=A0ABY0I5V1_9GAMM|nr:MULTISPECIES: Qat anti-phage system ATPase QatA [Aliivibrio]MDD9175928.1 P-loop NTPase fold protein [Aliivibrio sp. S3TY1]MDD9193157.1 P-loop NTPase fold protein [Aliivibrio sp. S2TY2]RYU64257.1 KAP P-loop [Aliivibrio finisterrensis]RYU83869.1 KAP P-loop [Aliivibrio finisterrensis]
MLWPDNESKVDLLNYQSISNAIAQLLSDKKRLPVSIGIHGDWGAGKSSVLSMIEEKYKDDNRTVCIRFNSWLYQGIEDAQTALMQQITADLMENKSTCAEFKEAAEGFLQRVDWLKVVKSTTKYGMAAIAGIAPPSTMQDLTNGLGVIVDKIKGLEGDDLKAGVEELNTAIGKAKPKRVVTEITEFRKAYKKLLDAADIDRLVILVDDLDRCLPDTAIATMEAMKLFLFMPNTAFIIAADETMIEYSVRRHFPNLSEEVGGMAYTRNYLEKLIQIPFRIPALSENETSIYLTLLIAQSVCDEDSENFNKVLEHARQNLREPWTKSTITAEQFEKITGETLSQEKKTLFFMVSQIATVLNEGTKGNPRQIKRFLNTFMTRMLIADSAGYKESINESVLIKLMLLERFNQNAYEILRLDSVGSAEGLPTKLFELEEQIKTNSAISDKEIKTDTKKVLFEIDKDEWLANWVKIEPVLGTTNLIPYFFLTREKVKFVGLAQSSELIERALKLLKGDDLAVTAAQGTIELLTVDDAESLLDILVTKIRSTAGAKNTPEYYKGALLLCKNFKDLQLKFLKEIAAIPENKIGPWVIAGWSRVELTFEAQKEFDELLKDWSESSNDLLKRTAKQQLKKAEK